MNWNELLQSALVLVVAFGLKWFLGLIGIEIDEAQFGSFVAAIVAWLLSLFGLNVARAAKVRGIR